MDKEIFGISIKKRIKAISVFILFTIIAYIARYHIENSVKFVLFVTIASTLLVIYAIPNKDWKEVRANFKKSK